MGVVCIVHVQQMSFLSDILSDTSICPERKDYIVTAYLFNHLTMDLYVKI